MSKKKSELSLFDRITQSVDEQLFSYESDILTESEQRFLEKYSGEDLVEKVAEIDDGEAESAELVKEEVENEILRHRVRELKADSKKKTRFYNTVERLTISWLIFIAVLVVLDSFDVPWNEGIYEFDIEPKILIALVTSTTASVIGLFFIVGRYLFPNNNNDK